MTMKQYTFRSNGEITITAKLTGAYREKNGEHHAPKFELTSVRCGDPNAFPDYDWNVGKRVLGYFHLIAEEDLLEDMYQHDDTTTRRFVLEMWADRQHYPAFPIALADMGRTVSERFVNRRELKEYEHETGRVMHVA
jgi:hypothetical protein